MTFLPVAQRELRVASRRKGAYRVRIYVGLAALVIASWVYLVSSHLQPARLSLTLFNALATVAFVYALLAGTRVTADCLSEEKREGTLGLLFLTDLRGYDVVFGKLAATSMNSLYGIVSLFPLLTVPLLMGGVSFGLVWRVALVLLNTLLFSLAAGIFVSGYARQERAAMGNTFLLILLFAVGMPALGAWLEYETKSSSDVILTAFCTLSPIFSYITSLDFGAPIVAAPVARNFWWSFGVIQSLVWLLLFRASRHAPRSWQDRPASPGKLRWRDRWVRWSRGNGEQRQALRRELMDVNPFLWLAGRDRLMGFFVWAVLGGFALLFLWGYLKYRDEWLMPVTAFASMIILHTTIKLWIGSEASRRFIEERRDASFELLLCTPITVREILRGQCLAMHRLFAKPMVAILAVDFLLLWMGLREQMNSEERQGMTLSFFAFMATFVTDYFALLWVAMWQGLSAKNTKNAGMSTWAYILIFPLILCILAMTFYMIFLERLAGWHLGTNHLILLYFGVGVVVDWGFGGWAFHQLNARFRQVALQRIQPATRRRFLGWLRG